MKAISISTEALIELRNILQSKKLESNSIRVFLSGMGWGGPSFNLALDEQKDEDLVTNVEDFNFLVEKSLNDQFGTFEIEYFNENGNTGIFVQPSNIGEQSGCSSCSGCN